MRTHELQKIIDALPPQTQGLREIKIISNEFMIPGEGILMLHPADYEVYERHLAKQNDSQQPREANETK